METPEQDPEIDILSDVTGYKNIGKPSQVYEDMAKFVYSKSYIHSKVVKGKLKCDHCGYEFPANLPFYIIPDDATETISCYPCHYKKHDNHPSVLLRKKREMIEQENKEKRFEREFAYRLALQILEKLKPFCKKIEIAGSIRRKVLEVKDIELVALNNTIEVSDGLFDTSMVRCPDFISTVKSLGKIIKGKPEDGRYVQIELDQEIKLDLFIPTETDYYRQLMIRTGSVGWIVKNISYTWTRKGWSGTEDGLRRTDECEKKGKIFICTAKNPVMPPVWESEQAFFEWIGVEYVSPEKRI